MAMLFFKMEISHRKWNLPGILSMIIGGRKY
jgi:hypothetical protein